MKPDTSVAPLGFTAKNVTRRVPLVLSEEILGGKRYIISCDLRNEDEDRHDAAVAAFEFFDSDGQLLIGPHRGFSASASFDAYRYFPCATENGGARELAVDPPPGARRMRVQVLAWKASALAAYGPLRLRPLATTAPSMAVSATPPALSRPQPAPAVRPEPTNARGAVVAELWADMVAFDSILLRAEVRAERELGEKPAVLAVEFRDPRFARIPGPYPGFSTSPNVGEYRYVTPTPLGEGLYAVREFIEPPADAASVRIRLLQWTTPLIAVARPEVARVTWHDYVSSLELDQQTEASLHRLADISVKQGDLASTLKLRQAVFHRTLREQDGLRVTALRALMTELDTTWLPRVMTPRPIGYVPDPASICHLFKVMYPQESSGGSVRNRNIVRAQARTGLKPVACLTFQADNLIDERAGDAAQRDGIVEIEREGVTVVYPRYLAFPRRRVAADLVLEAETNLHVASVQRHRCSVIHAASGFKGFDNALKGIALARHFGLPFVYEVRSFHEHTWGPLDERTFAAPLTRLRSAQEDRCMAEADAVVTISEAMVTELAKRGAARERLFLIPNSVDDHFLEPPDGAKVQELRERHGLVGRTVVGYISNISRREGHAVLLRAFARMAAEQDTLTCLFVGAGSERANLEQLAAELGVGDRLILTGEVDHELIREYYALIDIFVVPRLSDYASDYVTPMKPFEALALGSRLIMSDRPVSTEVIGQDERGLMFRTGEVDDLVEKIRQVMTIPETALERARIGQIWVRQHRTWAQNASRYREIYAAAREALAERRRG